MTFLINKLQLGQFTSLISLQETIAFYLILIIIIAFYLCTVKLIYNTTPLNSLLKFKDGLKKIKLRKLSKSQRFLYLYIILQMFLLIKAILLKIDLDLDIDLSKSQIFGKFYEIKFINLIPKCFITHCDSDFSMSSGSEGESDSESGDSGDEGNSSDASNSSSSDMEGIEAPMWDNQGGIANAQGGSESVVPSRVELLTYVNQGEHLEESNFADALIRARRLRLDSDTLRSDLDRVREDYLSTIGLIRNNINNHSDANSHITREEVIAVVNDAGAVNNSRIDAVLHNHGFTDIVYIEDGSPCSNYNEKTK